jgi:protein CpxP
MKTVKSFALIAGLACITLNISAQEKAKMDPQQWAQTQTAQIKASVTGITADQESKILAIEQDFAKSMQDARANSNGDHEAMRAKMQPVKEARDTKIKALLTADQSAQYDKYLAAHPMGGGHRGGN